MTGFEDIRPYHDDEVEIVVTRLLQDDEFIRSITAFKFPKYPKVIRGLIQPFVKLALTKQIESVKNVADVQQVISQYLDQVIEKTISKITISGLENLSPEQPYLFISNHRDIVMDPAFVNYALFHNGFETVRIAIGDNLLQKPFVSDLMRLNKSFIVKRSASGVREKLKTYMDLSSYIHHSIDTGCPIWIAQREGRAKDGIDQTEPAIIKMLYMSQKKGEQSFGDYVNWLNIVPVTISYEYNPCDQLIAKELYEVEKNGVYNKAKGEDISSIVTGITGHKGHVHVAFGEVLKGDFDDAESVANEIDRQIKANTVFHPSNYIAAQQLDSSFSAETEISKEKQEEFSMRMAECKTAMLPHLLALYANSLLQKPKL